MRSIGWVPYRNIVIWLTSVFLVKLAILAAWSTLLGCLSGVNWTSFVVLAKYLDFCSKAPLSCTLWITKGGCALRSVVFGTTVCK